MEDIKRQLETIYLELLYIKLEWEFMKEIDETLIKNELSFEAIKIIVFCIIDSLWYAIVMRIAKICDNTKRTKSLKKLLDKLETDPNLQDIRNKITFEKLSKIKYDIESAIKNINISDDNVNSIIGSRHEYFAHLGALKSPAEAQNKYFIGRKKLNNLVEVLSEKVEELCKELNVDIAQDDERNKINILKDIEYPYFIKSLNNKC